MGKTCEICGANSGMYPICAKCFKLRDEGKATKCEKCGTWHYTDKPCKCEPATKEVTNNIKTPEKVNNVVVINNENKSKCITCGKSTDGLLFCPSCYHKYCNKELLIKITNCSNVELLDDSYEGKYNCKDGHVVKSKSERDIDNFLFAHDIPHAYEKQLAYGADSKQVLHPDFYLPNYLGPDKDVYIEHWGYDENNIEYTNTKKFKMPIYKELNITLICTYENRDASDIDSALERKLKKSYIKENSINYEE